VAVEGGYDDVVDEIAVDVDLVSMLQNLFFFAIDGKAKYANVFVPYSLFQYMQLSLHH
jgi:hypothetical protein